MAISNVQTAKVGTTGTSLTLASYAAGTGSNRKLIVAAAYRKGGASTTPISGVTFGGSAMTLIAEVHATDASNAEGNTLFEFDNPSGTADIVATWTAANGGRSIIAFLLTDIDATQAAEASVTATGSSSPLNTNITTVTNNAVMISTLNNRATSDLTPTQSGQTKDVQVNYALDRHASSNKTAGAAGTYAMGWSSTTIRLACHVVAAFKVAAAGLSIPVVMSTYRRRR